ncbi:helix-turn-helix domain-containing protein [Leptospira johnsonii]|uniref:DNA-binding helix-turn-helix protein n=1 Tax=Leptospira johnsonii TaxID=1917820 RepID=A0A2P2D0B6_9LEPT|nr:AraC family transcriptional regulator [Leptospira johnsonii]GBF38092.1 DNA-binding helix-turn-helix protein [Leptospira johnsonii]
MKSNLYIWPDKVLYSGKHFETESHKHFLAQSIVGVHGPIHVELENSKVSSDFVFIPGNTTHRIIEGPKNNGDNLILLYTDPHSKISAALEAEYNQPENRTNRNIIEKLKEYGGREFDPLSLDNFLSGFHRSKIKFEIPKIDPRIILTLELLKNWDFEKTPDLKTFAEKTKLSPGRFTHLFSESLGIPFKRFVLWTKLTKAVLALKAGKNLTEVCHESGFSDSAHFSRTFMDMFGVNPSKFLTDSRSVQLYIFDPV